jgi:hypothetical protein
LCIPLAQSGTELLLIAYNSGWWKVKPEYRKWMRNLKYHQLCYEENMEELLLPLVADDETMLSLLKDPCKALSSVILNRTGAFGIPKCKYVYFKITKPVTYVGGPAWKNPEVDGILRNRMPKLYPSFSETIDIMLENVEGLIEALGLVKGELLPRSIGDPTVAGIGASEPQTQNAEGVRLLSYISQETRSSSIEQ